MFFRYTRFVSLVFTISFLSWGWGEPYVVGVNGLSEAFPVATVGQPLPTDSEDGSFYYMGGIPDGVGVWDHEDGTFELFVSHEIKPELGTVRKHGAKGAFVSSYHLTKPGHADGDFKVLSAKDAIDTVFLWNRETGIYYPETEYSFARLCSANVAPQSAFFYKEKGIGFEEGLYLSGEEMEEVGRAFALVISGAQKGSIYELPTMGRMMFENLLANAFTKEKSLVVAIDDNISGQVYLHLGTKRRAGNPVERAGLTSGSLFGVAVLGKANELSEGGIMSGDRFEIVEIEDAVDLSAEELEERSHHLGITVFTRPEDGHWDPRNSNVFYFATTGARTRTADFPSTIYRLRFDDVENPEKGGVIEIVLREGDGSFLDIDNITVDERGMLWLQEDPGADVSLARIFRFDLLKEELLEVARLNPEVFVPGGNQFLTTNEESSGIIDLSHILGAGYYALTVQSHVSLDSMEDPIDGFNRMLLSLDEEGGRAAVEDGQLLIMKISERLAE